MNLLKRIGLFLACILLPWVVNAQGAGQQEVYQGEESNKMFVVFIVISVIFLGLTIFLFSLDNRIRKLEKQHHNHKN